MRQLAPLLMAAANEPFFMDDILKNSFINKDEPDPVALALYILDKGELFLSMTPDGRVIGFQILRDILHQRSAYMEAWANPEFRGAEGKADLYWHFNEVIQYAFDDWPKGLGLQKIKAEVAVENHACLITCRNLGFIQTGGSPLDQYHNGVPYDTVHLELLNPAVFSNAVEEINNEQQEITAATNLHTAATAATDNETAGSEDSSAADTDSSGSDGQGTSGRELIAGIFAT